MKKAVVFLSVLLLAALFASCDGVSGDYKTTDSKLRGTWESNVITDYHGTLKIGMDSIIITGYEKNLSASYPALFDDPKLPFKGFAKGPSLTCYTEDGKLFIKNMGDVQSFPYEYSSADGVKYLYFDFGGRKETLKLNPY